MVFSSADKAIAERAYALSKKQAAIPGAMLGMSIAIMGPSFIEILQDPHTSHTELIVYSAFLGFTLAAAAMASFFISRQRKQDLEIARFFEKHFPEDCSWKQEEKILAQAEDLRQKAKVDRLIHENA